MKIYFAGSIRGGRQDVILYQQIITYLKNYGQVLTEHIGDTNLSSEDEVTDKFIHDRDMEWLLSADAVVAEVTQPSIGVGYELGRAVEHGMRILCLYRPDMNNRLSAMIAGCSKLELQFYSDFNEAKGIIDTFMETFSFHEGTGREL